MFDQYIYEIGGEIIPQFDTIDQVFVYALTTGVVTAFLFFSFLIWSGRKKVEIRVDETKTDNDMQAALTKFLGMTVEQFHERNKMVDKLNVDVRVLSADKARIEAELKLALYKLDANQKEIDRLKVSLEEVESENDLLREDRQKLKQRISELEAENSSLRMQLGNLRLEFDNFKTNNVKPVLEI